MIFEGEWAAGRRLGNVDTCRRQEEREKRNSPRRRWVKACKQKRQKGKEVLEEDDKRQNAQGSLG